MILKSLFTFRRAAVQGGRKDDAGMIVIMMMALVFVPIVVAHAAMMVPANAGAQQIAWSAVGRLAIANDPNWRNGDYYDAQPGEGPQAGLALARQIAQIHYRTEPVFEQRFGRNSVTMLASGSAVSNTGIADWSRYGT